MRRLIYQVYVGPRCNLYDFCTESVAAYCHLHGIKHVVQREAVLRIKPDPKTSGRSEGAARLGYLPIFEKELGFVYLHDFDEVAIIDADIFIRPGARDIFDERNVWPFAGVYERGLPLTEEYKAKLRGYCPGQYARLKRINWHWKDGIADFMNMGVMVMNRALLPYLRGETAGEFLARPEFKRFVDGVGAWKWSTDQTLLNWWLRHERVLVQPLDWRWNALYGALERGKIEEAHFVHFFLRDYLPDKGEDIEWIRKTLTG